MYCSPEMTDRVRDLFKIGDKALHLPLNAVDDLYDMGILSENPCFNQMQSILKQPITVNSSYEQNQQNQEILVGFDGSTLVTTLPINSAAPISGSITPRIPINPPPPLVHGGPLAPISGSTIRSSAYSQPGGSSNSGSNQRPMTDSLSSSVGRRSPIESTPLVTESLLRRPGATSSRRSHISLSMLRKQWEKYPILGTTILTKRFGGRPSLFKNITASAKAPVPLKLSRDEELQQTKLINILINNMPENSMLFRADRESPKGKSPKGKSPKSTIRQRVVDTLRGESLEKLTLVLKLQTKVKDHLLNLRTDETFKLQVLEQLKKDQNVVETTGFLKYYKKDCEELEMLLEFLADKNISVPNMIGCTIPFNFLEKVENWFMDSDLLTNLTKKRDHVVSNQSFLHLNSKQKLTMNVFENVRQNLSMLIKAAHFFEYIIRIDNITSEAEGGSKAEGSSKDKKSSKNKKSSKRNKNKISARDHVLVQPFANILLDFCKRKGMPSRDFPKNDFFEAFISTEVANQLKTSGGVMSLYDSYENGTPIIKLIEEFHNTTIIHPLYILSTIPIAEMCKEDTLENTFLKKSAENYLLGEERIQDFLNQYEFNSPVLEGFFFEIILLFRSNQQHMEQVLISGPFSYEQTIDAVKDFGRYINAACFLIEAYGNIEGTEGLKEAIKALKDSWQEFLEPLRKIPRIS